MIFLIFLQGVFLFCSIPLGLFILNNLNVSFLSRSFDKFIIFFSIGISFIALIQLFLSGWFVLTFWFPLTFSPLFLSLKQNTQIKSELTIRWKPFLFRKVFFGEDFFYYFHQYFIWSVLQLFWIILKDTIQETFNGCLNMEQPMELAGFISGQHYYLHGIL